MTETSTVYLMTEKKNTKDCPCTYPGCLNICRVNTFYAPAKAKCPEHGGKAVSGTVEGGFSEIATPAVEQVEVEVTPNHKVRQLMCPICDSDEPLEILAATEDGHIDFGCQGCWIIVSLSFNWKPLQVRSIPDRLKPVVKEFNVKQVGTMDLEVARQTSRFGAA